jgi:hypothetical protein
LNLRLSHSKQTYFHKGNYFLCCRNINDHAFYTFGVCYFVYGYMLCLILHSLYLCSRQTGLTRYNLFIIRREKRDSGEAKAHRILGKCTFFHLTARRRNSRKKTGIWLRDPRSNKFLLIYRAHIDEIQQKND